MHFHNKRCRKVKLGKACRSTSFFCILLFSLNSHSTQFHLLENWGSAIAFTLVGDDQHYRSFNVPINMLTNKNGYAATTCYRVDIDVTAQFLSVLTDVGKFALYHTVKKGITFLSLTTGSR